MIPLVAWEPWSAAKVNANFWRWITIDLIVVSLLTYVFDLLTLLVSFFVVASE